MDLEKLRQFAKNNLTKKFKYVGQDKFQKNDEDLFGKIVGLCKCGCSIIIFECHTDIIYPTLIFNSKFEFLADYDMNKCVLIRPSDLVLMAEKLPDDFEKNKIEIFVLLKSIQKMYRKKEIVVAISKFDALYSKIEAFLDTKERAEYRSNLRQSIKLFK